MLGTKPPTQGARPPQAKTPRKPIVQHPFREVVPDRQAEAVVDERTLRQGRADRDRQMDGASSATWT